MAQTLTKRSCRAMAAILALAVLSTGCGGDDKKEAAPTTEKAKATTTTEAGEDETTTTEADGDGAQILSKEGATASFAGGPAVLGDALGVPDSMASIDGKLLRVSANYSGPGTTNRIPSQTWTIDMIREEPLADAAKAVRAHFTEAGFTFTPTSTGKDMTGTIGTPGNVNEYLLGATLEETDDGTTKVELLLSHNPPEGSTGSVDGKVFAFVENLGFGEAMVFAHADVAFDSGQGSDVFEDLDPYVSFAASFEVPVDGYDTAKAALEKVCAGQVEGYGCDTAVEPFDGDGGVQVSKFRSSDGLTFEVVLFRPGNAGNTAPVFQFTFIGDGIR